MKILYKILLITLLPSLILVMTLSYMSLETFRENITELSDEYTQDILQSTAGKIRIYLKNSIDTVSYSSKMKIISNFIQQSNANNLNEDGVKLMDDFLKDLSKSITDALIISIFDKSGVIIASSREDLLNESIKSFDFFKKVNSNGNKPELNLKETQVVGIEKGNIIIRISHSIISETTQEIIGGVTVVINFKNFIDNNIAPVKPFKSGYVFLTDIDNNIIYYPEEISQIRDRMSDSVLNSKMWREGGKTSFIEKKEKVYLIVTFGEISKMRISLKIYDKDLYYKLYTSVKDQILTTVLFFIIFTIISGFFVLILVRQITVAIKYTSVISSGDFTQNISEKITKKKDEIGLLAKSLEHVKDSISSFFVDIKEVANDLIESSTELKNSAVEISNQSTLQASQVEEISSSIEQIAGNVETNSYNAMETKSIAQDMQKAILKGNQAVNKTLEAIELINKKITLVQEIASNTNLISLNASIEAARAGYAGRGFSIVATEVGKLAFNSRKVSDEILDLALDSLEISQQASEIFNNILPKVENTTQLIEDIATSSNEQKLGILQIKDAISNLENSIQSKNLTADNLLKTADVVDSQADTLGEKLDLYKF